MALFNSNKSKKAQTTVQNLAGGEAFAQTPEMELASLLLTSFAQEQFYRSQNQTFTDLKNALMKCAAAGNADFAAKAGIYARTNYGMRSISHVLAVELAPLASGNNWAKKFYDKIIYRPDDMLEIAALYFAKNKDKHLPNALKKGFAQAFERFDDYQLAKYRGEGRAVKLIDLVNLVRPIPTTRNQEGLKKLVANELRNTETWEAKMTAAGQHATDEAEKTELKAAAWAALLQSNKLGYMALLRNLRNIAEQAPDLTPSVVSRLTDKNAITKSLVLPFRFVTAIEEIQKTNLENKNALVRALNKAIDLSLANVPRFEGKTLLVLDDSGSMTSMGYGSKLVPIKVGAMFAAALYKSNDADLMCFSDGARYVRANPDDTTMTIAEQLIRGAKAGGTNFHAIFEAAGRAYDRIIILSDMQGWVGSYAPTQSYTAYKQRTNANPYIYSMDLAGYGTMQFLENQVFALAGFSEKVFDLMKLLETDRQALVNDIKKITLT